MTTTPTRFRRLSRYLLAILAVPAVGAAAYVAGNMLAGTPGRPIAVAKAIRGVAVADADVDLGEVWERSDHTATLTLLNTNRHAVEITRFATACDCTAADPPRLSIPAGGAATLTVRLDLSRRLPYEFGLARRAVQVRIDPTFAGDQSASPGWTITADVKSRVVLDTHTLAFGDAVRRGESTNRTVRATVADPADRLEAVGSFETVTAAVEKVNPTEYLIRVTPDARLAVGPFTAAVQVVAVTADGVRHPGGTIAVSGDVQPTTRAFPRVVLLGAQPAGAATTAEATVWPAAGWAVARVETDTPAVTVAKSGATADSGQTYTLTQTIAAGDGISEIVFVLRRADGATERVPVTVRYFGQSPATAGGKP
jgi:hypothetical protein